MEVGILPAIELKLIIAPLLLQFENKINKLVPECSGRRKKLPFSHLRENDFGHTNGSINIYADDIFIVSYCSVIEKHWVFVIDSNIIDFILISRNYLEKIDKIIEKLNVT